MILHYSRSLIGTFRTYYLRSFTLQVLTSFYGSFYLGSPSRCTSHTRYQLPKFISNLQPIQRAILWMAHGKLQDPWKILFFALLLSFVNFFFKGSDTQVPSLKKVLYWTTKKKSLASKWLTIKKKLHTSNKYFKSFCNIVWKTKLPHWKL